MIHAYLFDALTLWSEKLAAHNSLEKITKVFILKTILLCLLDLDLISGFEPREYFWSFKPLEKKQL